MQVHINRKQAHDLGLPLPKEGGNILLYEVRLASEPEAGAADLREMLTHAELENAKLRGQRNRLSAQVTALESAANAIPGPQPAPAARPAPIASVGSSPSADPATPQGRSRRHP